MDVDDFPPEIVVGVDFGMTCTGLIDCPFYFNFIFLFPCPPITKTKERSIMEQEKCPVLTVSEP